MDKKSKKKFHISSKAYLVASIAIALIGFCGIVSANLDLGSRLIDKLADKISPELILERLGLSAPLEMLGLATIDSANTGLTNLRLAGTLEMGSSVDAEKFLVTQADIEDWPAASSSIRFSNDRSTTSTMARLIIDGTGTKSKVVSSSVLFSCGNVDANPTYTYNSLPGTRPSGIINGYHAVTGTQPYYDSFATTTPSVLVGPGESVDCIVQHVGLIQDITDCIVDGGGCEAVTSTNRGWDANVIVLWQWVTE